MCGICGIYNFNEAEKVDENDLAKMNKALSHRGPDDSGVFIDRNIGLGQSRLSIIDLSASNSAVFLYSSCIQCVTKSIAFLSAL